MLTSQNTQTVMLWRVSRGILAVSAILLVSAAWWSGQSSRQHTKSSTNSTAAVLAGGTQNVPLTITAAIENYQDNGDGTWTVRYRYTIHNPSNITANFISATSEITQDKPGGPQFTIVSFTSPSMSLNPNFNAKTVKEMLTGPNILSPGQTKLVYLTVRVTYGMGDPNVYNRVTVFGEGQASGGGSTSSPSPTSASTSNQTTGSPGSSTAAPTSTATASSSASQEQYQDDDIVTFRPGITSTYSVPCCIK